MRQFHVYILANRSRTIYVGVTGNLRERVHRHKTKQEDGFTAKYNITRLVWYESFPDAAQAIECEKRIKGWIRARKIALIESTNKYWRDLASDWYPDLLADANAERPA